MARDTIDGAVLESARMLQDMFDSGTLPAIERRIAWALDCSRIEEAMYWLRVQSVLFGLPPLATVYRVPSA